MLEVRITSNNRARVRSTETHWLNLYGMVSVVTRLILKQEQLAIAHHRASTKHTANHARSITGKYVRQNVFNTTIAYTIVHIVHLVAIGEANWTRVECDGECGVSHT